MADFAAFFQLGFRHITDPNGLDHVLFLLVLAAIYQLRDWRPLLAVVTAFTIGHSLTLALAVSGVVLLPMDVIEFLIPVTIVATGIENLWARQRGRGDWHTRYRPLFAALFGLVHGAGFANYLRSLFVDQLAVPLLAFNLGIEAGQVAVLAVAVLLFALMDRAFGRVRLPRLAASPLRMRTVAVSAVVAVIAAGWAVERSPW